MNQTSIDLKIAGHERTKQLTFRPVYRDIPPLKYEVAGDGGSWVVVKVFPGLFSIQHWGDAEMPAQSRIPSLGCGLLSFCGLWKSRMMTKTKK
jgi:hypothetical protein